MSYNQINDLKMKKITKILMLLAVVSISAFTRAKAQDIVVSMQLKRPPEYERNERERPGRPDRRYVWVSEGWDSRGGHYSYKPGVWALPPHPGAYWVPGHWAKYQYRPGYKWFPGYWH
jgi:hypothetical protein